jgi:hypothetical protein
LNKNGDSIISFELQCYYHRYNLKKQIKGIDCCAQHNKKKFWKTNCDYANNNKFYSLHAGTIARTLSRNWVDYDAEDSDDMSSATPTNNINDKNNSCLLNKKNEKE